MPSGFRLERGGVTLAGVDFGGAGGPALLMHGLAGHAREWTETARWLTGRCHVVALDARGHGGSERFPAEVSLAEHAADAAFAIERLALGSVVALGQSLGGQVAMLLAAERPELVRGLVVADASPAGAGEAVEEEVAAVTAWLGRGPVPFPSREAAVEFFGGPSLSAEAWSDGLERRDGGWWPRFDADLPGPGGSGGQRHRFAGRRQCDGGTGTRREALRAGRCRTRPASASAGRVAQGGERVPRLARPG